MRIETGDGWELRCGNCLDPETGLASLEAVDHVITDPPYSERTHRRHDASAGGHRGFGNDGSSRSKLGYGCWGPDMVAQAGAAFSRARGWVVVMCDHTQSPWWEEALGDRYVFPPLPFYAPGSRARLGGDGPASWTIWIVVARTRSREMSRWGTLPGGYVAGPGWRERKHMGGKPLPLMERLVSDYSRGGDLVADPCAGSGTTGVACIRLGRRFIGWEKDPGVFETAVKRLRATRQQFTLFEGSDPGKQETLI